MSREFDIEEEWLSFEIHPETPAAGVLLTEHLPHIDWDDLYRNLKQQGARYDIIFNDVTILANSRKVLEASEFARDNGKYDTFHEAVFKAYFTDLKDIGRLDVIYSVADEVGLDTAGLQQALEQDTYYPRLQQTTAMAHSMGINSAPTFIINKKYSVVGAQPTDAFRDILQKAASEG